MEGINYSLIVLSAIASPGPAIAGTLMSYGQRLGNQWKSRRYTTYSSMKCYPARR